MENTKLEDLCLTNSSRLSQTWFFSLCWSVALACVAVIIGKFSDRKISMEDFYKKRYIKIWPYFALLCVLDFVVSPSKESLFEVFANLTLCQGLLPNANISVIGVSWTLAVIFVFYMLFSFSVFCLETRSTHGRGNSGASI